MQRILHIVAKRNKLKPKPYCILTIDVLFNFPLRILLIFSVCNMLKQVFSQKQSNMNIALIGYGRMGHEIEVHCSKKRT